MTNELGAQNNLYDEYVFRLLLEHEVAYAQRYPTPLSLLHIGLALINPTQAERENAPIALAKILNSRLRRADIPARIGSDFLVLMPNTDEKGPRAVCERLLRTTLGTQQIEPGFATRVTICIGMASHPGGPTLSAERLMHEAKMALKQALALGPQTYHAYGDTLIRQPD